MGGRGSSSGGGGSGKSVAAGPVKASLADRLSVLHKADSSLWFGDRKVFISALGKLSAHDVAELHSMHQSGKITLSRADLVAAMNPHSVAASELNLGGGTYHFVNVTPRKT